MAVTFATLFARLGRLMDFAKVVRAHQDDLRTEFEATMAQYTDADRDQVKTLTSNIEDRINEAGMIVADIRADATTTLLEMMDDDTSLPAFNVKEALKLLIVQMVAANSCIDRPSSGYVTLPTGNKGTAGSLNTGTGIFLASDIMPFQGYDNDVLMFLDRPSALSETINAECMSDATTPTTPDGQEIFRLEGMRPVGKLDEDWPDGSGTKGSIGVASPNKNAGSTPGKNICHNSSFNAFTSNIPDQWTLVAGTAGTHVYSSGAAGFGPLSTASSLRLVGDGSTNPNIKQTLRVNSGSLGEINPDTPYSISVAVKYATARPTSNLIFSVRDSGGTILNDTVINRKLDLTIASGDIGTSYAIFSIVGISPIAIAKGTFIDIRFSGNQANTSQVFVSDLVIAEMKQMQFGGLYYQIIGGATRYAIGDKFSLAVVNNRANRDGEFALEFDRFFNLGDAYNLALPSNTSPTIADTLIT